MTLCLLLHDFVLCFFFFFSSRRRHTRFDCDWSSDVCSSDLADETNPSQTPAEHLYDLDCAVLTKRDAAAGLEFSSGMPHREPRAIRQLTDQQDLRVSRVPFPVQPRGYDARRIEDQQVAGGNQREGIAEVKMSRVTRSAIEDEEPARCTVAPPMLS